MSNDTSTFPTDFDTAAIMGALYGDGIIACKGAFERKWVERLGRSIGVLFQEALRQPGGALERTQWDVWDGDSMFPAADSWPRYEERRQQKMPQMGDISARSALTVHRGTANVSTLARPVFVLGVDAPDARNADKHDLQCTRGYYDALAPELRRHLSCRVVDTLEPIVQAHTIAGLLVGQAG